MSFKTRSIKLFVQEFAAPDPKPKCRHANDEKSVDDYKKPYTDLPLDRCQLRRALYPDAEEGAEVLLLSVGTCGSSSHLPATDIFVPQQAQTPSIARRPFFMSVRVADSISCFARQRTQYPIKVTSQSITENGNDNTKL